MKRRSSPRRTTSGSAGLPDPAEWLKAHPQKSRGPSCVICDRADVREKYEKAVALGYQQTWIANYLRDVFGLTQRTHSFVGNHARNHGDRS